MTRHVGHASSSLSSPASSRSSGLHLLVLLGRGRDSDNRQRETVMPSYMVQATYTAEAWRKLVQHPEDRRVAIGALIDTAGGRLVDLWFAFGENDIVFVFEAPDNLTAGAVSVAGTTAGHIRSIRTTQLLTVEESMEIMRKAASLGPAQSPTGAE